jgi:uncharacterized protein YcbK (DUF882 family)
MSENRNFCGLAVKPRRKDVLRVNNTNEAGKAPSTQISRRTFTAGLVSAAFAIPAPALAISGTTNRLRMLAPNTNEKFDADLIVNGSWDEEALAAFNHFARDWRADSETEIDRGVIMAAMKIQSMMDSADPLHLLSGYRTPETNRRLRGAARNSMHLKGRAFDLRQPGRSTADLHAAAQSLKAGGVGRYNRSGFVHVDTGPIRHWNG